MRSQEFELLWKSRLFLSISLVFSLRLALHRDETIFSRPFQHESPEDGKLFETEISLRCSGFNDGVLPVALCECSGSFTVFSILLQVMVLGLFVVTLWVEEVE